MKEKNIEYVKSFYTAISISFFFLLITVPYIINEVPNRYCKIITANWF